MLPRQVLQSNPKQTVFGQPSPKYPKLVNQEIRIRHEHKKGQDYLNAEWIKSMPKILIKEKIILSLPIFQTNYYMCQAEIKACQIFVYISSIDLSWQE